MTDLTIDIGIDETDRQAITEGLSQLLADSYTLYLKTHTYHWNVTRPMFQTLHLMFETQYNERPSPPPSPSSPNASAPSAQPTRLRSRPGGAPGRLESAVSPGRRRTRW